MESIHIKNFGGIKEMTMEINKINILIGPQASGKSVTAKLIYFFKKIPFDILYNIEIDNSEYQLIGILTERFLAYFPKSTWPSEGFKISYYINDATVSISKKKESELSFVISGQYYQLHRQGTTINEEVKKMLTDEFGKVSFFARKTFQNRFYDDVEQFLSERSSYTQLYLPAGRSFFSSIQSGIFSLIKNNDQIDPFILEFGQFYEQFRRRMWNEDRTSFKSMKSVERLIELVLNGKYRSEGEIDYITHGDGRTVDLYNASSGQQEAMPMMFVLRALNKVKLSTDGVSLFIEEPETHLFPSAQSQIVKLIAHTSNDYTSKSELFITTHSPYILSSFNNLMEAGKIAKEQPDKKNEIEKVVPKEEWLNPDDVNAYSITAGKLESLIDKETKLISQNHLDSVSDDLAIDFGKLLDIEY
jgi:ABC-type dipeptide/oligopeptide/nickel transport system ATPase component